MRLDEQLGLHYDCPQMVYECMDKAFHIVCIKEFRCIKFHVQKTLFAVKISLKIILFQFIVVAQVKWIRSL